MRPFEQVGQGGFDQSRGGWMLLGRLLRWSMRNCRDADPGGDAHPDRNMHAQAPTRESLDAIA